MGVLIKADEILANLITIILHELKWPLIVLIWLSIVALAILQQNGTCAPSPLGSICSLDFVDNLVNRYDADTCSDTCSEDCNCTLAIRFIAACAWGIIIVERVSEIIRKLFRYSDHRRNPEKYIRLADLAGEPLCIECNKCDRWTQYYLDAGFDGPYAKISDWLSRDCPRKRAKLFSGKTDDICGARWWVPDAETQSAD
jgi:hypothetical protein